MLKFFDIFSIKSHALSRLKHVLKNFISMLVDTVQLFNSLWAGKGGRIWAIGENVHLEVSVCVVCFHFLRNDLFKFASPEEASQHACCQFTKDNPHKSQETFSDRNHAVFEESIGKAEVVVGNEESNLRNYD